MPARVRAETVAEANLLFGSSPDLHALEMAVTGDLPHFVGCRRNLNDTGNTNNRSVSFTNATVGVTGEQGTHLTSDGHTVQFGIFNGVLVGYINNDPIFEKVFTVSLNDDNSGSYTFTLLGNLDDAPNSNAIALTFNFTATDSDSDTSSNTFTVTVQDDMPIAHAGDATTVNEANLPDGTAPLFFGLVSPSVSGDLNITWGADNNNSGSTNNRSVAFTDNDVTVTTGSPGHTTSLSGLTSDGQPISYTVLNGVLVAYTGSDPHSHQVFTVSLSDVGDGLYTFTLLGNLDHPAGQGTNLLNFTFNYTATDSDGDTSSNHFTVSVKDSVPITSGDVTNGTVGEDGLSTGNDIHGATHTVVLTNQALNIDWGADNATVSATDPAGRTLTFNTDHSGITPVDSHGNALNLTSDGVALQYVMTNLADGGQQLQAYQGSPANNVLIFTVTLDPTSTHGDYNFTLSGNLDHSSSATPANDLNLNFAVTATDSDGDSVQTNFTVDVKDDVPTTVGTVAPTDVYEPGLSNGNGQGIAADVTSIGTTLNPQPLNIHWGADDGTDPADAAGRALSFLTTANHAINGGAGTVSDLNISVTGQSGTENGGALSSHGVALQYVVTALANGGELLTAYNSNTHDASTTIFTLALDPTQPNGGYVFNLFGPLDDASNSNTIGLTFKVQATDSDGDSTPVQFQVNVQDDVPVAVTQTPVAIIDGSFQGNLNGGSGDFNLPGPWSSPLGATDQHLSIDNGAWTYTASTVGAGTQVELERVDSGYAGSFSTDHSPMVDLEASPGNIQISQTIQGLTAGEHLVVSFEIGEANFGNAKLEVLWDNTVVGTYDPQNGLMQTESLALTANGTSDTLTFREIGVSGDNTGTFLTDVSAQQVAGSVDEGGLHMPAFIQGPTFVAPSVGNDQGTAVSTSGTLAGLVHFGADGPAMNGNAANGFQFVAQNNTDATTFVTGLHLTSLGSAVDHATLSGNVLTRIDRR